MQFISCVQYYPECNLGLFIRNKEKVVLDRQLYRGSQKTSQKKGGLG